MCRAPLCSKEGLPCLAVAVAGDPVDIAASSRKAFVNTLIEICGEAKARKANGMQPPPPRCTDFSSTMLFLLTVFHLCISHHTHHFRQQRNMGRRRRRRGGWRMGAFVALAVASVHQVHGGCLAFQGRAAGPPCMPSRRRAVAGGLSVTAAAGGEQEGGTLDQSKVRRTHDARGRLIRHACRSPTGPALHQLHDRPPSSRR